jgi:hypothetical protein
MRIVDQDPADRHSAMKPYGSGRADLDVALAFTVPAGDQHALPARIDADQHLRQVEPPRPSGTWPTVGAGQPGWRRIVERGIEPQARDPVILCWVRAVSSSRDAKPLSTIRTMSRSGSQRRACRTSWRAQSVGFLCRRPRSQQYRLEGTSVDRNGSKLI